MTTLKKKTSRPLITNCSQAKMVKESSNQPNKKKKKLKNKPKNKTLKPKN